MVTAFLVSNTTSGLYENLGIQACDTTEEVSEILRQLTTDELKRNEAKYLPFLHNVQENQYDDLVKDFQRPGVFAGDMGDLIVKSMANVLKTPLVILTNISNYKVITVTPDEFHNGNDSIFLTYTRDGPGHYDALVHRDYGRTDKPESTSGNVEDSIKYTCGMSRKQNKPSCTDKMTDSRRTYNPNGPKIPENQAELKRRRAESDLKGERMDGVSYLMSKNENVTHGKWTDEENFIFLQYIEMHPNVLIENNSDMSVTVTEFTQNFNSTLMQMGVIESGSGQLKTENQIKNKIKNVKKKKELLYRLVDDDIRKSINTMKQDLS